MYTRLVGLVHKYFNIDADYFLRGGFWLTTGQSITILAGLVSTAVFAHFLSEQQYGMYRYLVGLAALLSVFSLTGLGQAILQSTAKGYFNFYHETFRLGLLSSLAISVISLSGALYYFYNQNTVLAIGCLLIACLQPIISTCQNVNSALQGESRYQTATLIHTIRMIVVTILSIGSLWLTQNILILFAVYLGSYALCGLSTHIWYRTGTAITPSKISDQYLSYAKHTSVRNIIAGVAQRLDSVIVFTQLGAAELAIYTIATIIPEQIKASFKNIATLLLPKYINHSDDHLVQKSIYARSRQLFVILLIITIVYIVIAPTLYSLLFPKYPAAIWLTQITALAFPTFIMLLPMSYLQAKVDEKFLYKITINTSLFQIVSLLIGVSLFGITGAIVSKFIYRIYYMFVIFVFLKKSKVSYSDVQ